MSAEGENGWPPDGITVRLAPFYVPGGFEGLHEFGEDENNPGVWCDYRATVRIPLDDGLWPAARFTWENGGLYLEKYGKGQEDPLQKELVEADLTVEEAVDRTAEICMDEFFWEEIMDVFEGTEDGAEPSPPRGAES